MKVGTFKAVSIHVCTTNKLTLTGNPPTAY